MIATRNFRTKATKVYAFYESIVVLAFKLSVSFSESEPIGTIVEVAFRRVDSCSTSTGTGGVFRGGS